MNTSLRQRHGSARVAGALLGLGGMLMLVGAAVASGYAGADTSPYELFCPGTPVGNIAVNGVVTTGTVTPADPAAGSQFNVTGYQTSVTIPASIVAAAAALGNTAITGSATTTLDVTGATPATLASPTMSFDTPIPSPVPSGGLTIKLPSPAATVGPFTASGGPISVYQDMSASLTLIVSGNSLRLTCTAYPNNDVPVSGITQGTPSGSPVSPLIATSDGSSTSTTTTTTPPAVALTGPYELFCPATPVGDIALNDATTSGTITPAPGAGDTFNVTGYQTSVNLPASIVGAAAALGNTAIQGSATARLDVSGATPATMITPTLSINSPIPNPVPDTGVALRLPDPPISVGPFTATGSAITVQEDSLANLTLTVSGQALSLTCTAYPNDSVPTGIADTTPTASPISPVIAVAGSTSTTTTTTVPGGSSTTSTTTTTLPPAVGPYELFCPGTPVGNIALNDVTTIGTITPASPNTGGQFNVTGYQTQVSIPAAIAAAAAALGNTAITGSATATVDAVGATPATLNTPTLSFAAAIPSPVPASGLTLQIPSPPATLGPFTATGGPITISEGSHASLTLIVSGNPLNLTCTAYPNDTTATGITTSPPSGSPVSPTITTGTATSTTTSTTTSSTTSTTTSTTTTSAPTTTTTSTTSTMPTTTTPTTTTPTSTSTTTSPGASTTTSSPGSTTTAGSGATTTAPPATRSGGGGTVSASSSALAFTGPGTGLRVLAAGGAVLLFMGLLLLVATDSPKQLLLAVARGRLRRH